MASIKQYRKSIYYFGRATIIYLQLRHYLRKSFAQDLRFPANLKHDYFYHSNYYNRTKQYMHANHFFGELLCLLRQKPISYKERMRFANLSACAPIFDDFFENKTDLSHIRDLLESPNPENALNNAEKLSVHFLQTIMETITQKKPFLMAAQDLFLAQTQSKNQKNKQLNKKQLLEISLKKGGYSGLMYAYLLEEQKNDLFIKIAFSLGSYGQIMDDIFDLYDDAKDGIRTFANQSSSVDEIRKITDQHIHKINDLLAEYSNYNLHFINVLQIFTSTIDMALKQYEKVMQTQNTSPLDCLTIDRRYWIIDMEKPQNIWSLFYLSTQGMK